MGKLRLKKMNYKLHRLQNGETFVTSERGSSMMPLINSGQKHRITPATWQSVDVDDIVYCRVNGGFLTHLVKAKNDKQGCLIGSNRGTVNGWTKQVYGKVIEVL